MQSPDLSGFCHIQAAGELEQVGNKCLATSSDIGEAGLDEGAQGLEDLMVWLVKNGGHREDMRL
jgi:hypothetical protein